VTELLKTAIVNYAKKDIVRAMRKKT